MEIVPILTSVRTQPTTTVTSMLNAAIKLALLAAAVTQGTLVMEHYALMMTNVQMDHITVLKQMLNASILAVHLNAPVQMVSSVMPQSYVKIAQQLTIVIDLVMNVVDFPLQIQVN